MINKSVECHQIFASSLQSNLQLNVESKIFLKYAHLCVERNDILKKTFLATHVYYIKYIPD